MASGMVVGGLEWPAFEVPAAAGTFESTGAALAAPRYGGDDHMDWGSAGWIVMVVVMSLFWAGVLALGFMAIVTFGRRGTRGGGETPLEIARRRYANGEITLEEFEAIKRNL